MVLPFDIPGIETEPLYDEPFKVLIPTKHPWNNKQKINAKELKNEKSLDELVEQLGDAKYVLLGEASHGTHEYYVLRAQLSKLLIEKK